MNAATAAGYCGEPSIASFRRRVGSHYPLPVNLRGRTLVWDKIALDEAIDGFSRPSCVDAVNVL